MPLTTPPQFTNASVELIAKSRLVAIVRLDDLSHAIELSQALLRGGIVALEFTLTNPLALDAMVQVRDAIPDFRNGSAVLGVGSVRTLDEARSALDAGADFLVTPITRRQIIRLAVERGVPIMPGAFTPTEIAKAWEAGAAAVKVFPARHLGPDYIKDVLAPMPYLKLMPTGGINLENLGSYLKNGAFAVGIGNQLLDIKAMSCGDWDTISRVARQYADAACGQSLRDTV